LLDGVRRLGFAGVNVTFPYKEAVIPLLDEMSARARDIGAVNTVVVHDGRLIGHNTDATGFERVDSSVTAPPGSLPRPKRSRGAARSPSGVSPLPRAPGCGERNRRHARSAHSLACVRQPARPPHTDRLPDPALRSSARAGG